MKIAIIGHRACGKSAIFKALTGMDGASAEHKVSVVWVPDDRIDRLSALYHPKKVTYASVEIIDLCGSDGLREHSDEMGSKFLATVRPCQVLLHVIDAFSQTEADNHVIEDAIDTMDYELALADFDQCEKRINRLKKQNITPGPMQNELELLTQASDWLSKGKALRTNTDLASHELLQSFAFLSAKPIVTLVNVSEDRLDWSTDSLPENISQKRTADWGRMISMCGLLESEIASLTPDDAQAFLADYNIDTPARDRVLRMGFDLLGTISFFTVGADEVKAWSITRGICAKEAASVIHSDIARGFIRAEVADYQTVLESGSFEAARKLSKVRLEGRDYIVKEADVISFRHNV